jgi:hypothetical protein
MSSVDKLSAKMCVGVSLGRFQSTRTASIMPQSWHDFVRRVAIAPQFP